MKKTLTEVLPSSGGCECDHQWQVVEGGSQDANKTLLVCKKANCGASKIIVKPTVQEAKQGKKILLG
jgi:hypothetical protein